MRTIALYICLLTTCFICGAKEITIIPQFALGDTLRYRATALVTLYHKNDSLVSTTKLLPKLMVEGKNDKGFVVKTTNKLETFSLECSDPEAKRELMLPDKTDLLNDFVAAIVLKIQLGPDGRPDSVLNMDEVKEKILDAYIRMFKKEQGIDVENNAEWETETMPLLTGAVNMICTPEHLLEGQFGNIPYFNFIGIPLKSGKIPASMVLTGDLQKMCSGVNELDMEINQTDDDIEHSVAPEDGLYSIRISGKSDYVEIEGLLLYSDGILSHGILSVKMQSESEKLITTLMLDPIR